MGDTLTEREVRDWLAGWQVVETLERQERRATPADPRRSVEQALGLIALWGRLHGWPAERDRVAERGVEAARRAWSRLHARWDFGDG
jgi:hypothetical protein